MLPEGTLRTDFAVRIIDTLFVRTAENLLFCYHGLNPMQLEKVENLAADLRVVSNITLVGEQPRHFRIGALGSNDSIATLLALVLSGHRTRSWQWNSRGTRGALSWPAGMSNGA